MRDKGKAELLPVPIPDTRHPIPSPDAVHALLTQANLFRLRQQFEEATECCIAVLQSDPGSQTAHSLLGDIYRDQGLLDDAIRWYRMALELEPNVSDAAKLRQLEQERDRLMGRLEQTQRPSALDTGVGLEAGTTNLMGVSPRRWLRGMGIASFSFLAIILVILGFMQLKRKDAAAVTRPKSGFQTVSSAPGLSHPLIGNDPLHPAPSLLNNQALHPLWNSSMGGSGLPPDRPANSPTVAPSSPRPPSDSTPTPQVVPPAPVVAVKPLPGGGEQPAGKEKGAAETSPPAEAALPDGLKITNISAEGAGRASVTIAAPERFATQFNSASRERLLRDVFQAAKSVFTSHADLSQIALNVQTQVESAYTPIFLLSAGIERGAAFQGNSTLDSFDTLAGRMQGLRWGVQEAGDDRSSAPDPGDIHISG